MNFLYVDNFRGFRETVIPLKKVNFLVGENSTGKTSLLALLRLLASPDFWVSQEFNTNYYEFGGFKDIVSAASQKKNEFWVGLLSVQNGKNSECYMMNFREEDGLPRIYRFAQVLSDKVATVLARPKSLRVRVEATDEAFPRAVKPDLLLPSFKKYLQTCNKGFKELPKQLAFVKRNLMAAFPTILEIVSRGELADEALKGFRVPGLTPRFIWLAPIRTKPKRTYDGYVKNFTPDGEHTPYIIRKQLHSEEKVSRFRLALERFGQTSGLFREVRCRQFGEEAAAPFELQIVLMKQPLRINSVGYGVSQVLPVVVELIVQGKNTWFGIQQPEVHLHPRAQAALGDLLFESACTEDKCFFVETHSDYMIDRYRLNFRKSTEPLPDSQVLFFERGESGNQLSILEVQPNGEYPTEQPKEFRSFFLKEQMNLLGI